MRQGAVHILPIVLDDCEIPAFLSDKLYADFRTSFSDGIDTLIKKLSGGRRIDTPHHPIIRSYEVPILSSSDDQIVALYQDKGFIFIQWSEERDTGCEIYIHKIEKNLLTTREAIGFELPGEFNSGFVRSDKGRIYSIVICEIEFKIKYQVWLFDIGDIRSRPDLIGEISNPYMNDAAIIGDNIVVAGVFMEY